MFTKNPWWSSALSGIIGRSVRGRANTGTSMSFSSLEGMDSLDLESALNRLRLVLGDGGTFGEDTGECSGDS